MGAEELQTRAQRALEELENVVVELVQSTPSGMANADIVRTLGIQSTFEGGHKNYLSWSIIGRLLESGRLKKATKPGSTRPVYYV
jgi:hypothetical protein